MLCAAIIAAIEDFAPSAFQESWDNTGVQVGSLRSECTGVLLCVDVTPAIVDEARERGCNLIISHHPLIFRGLKSLRGNTPVEEAVMKAIVYGITVYSCHTAVDSTPGGVSYRMAAMLGATPQRVLSPLKGRMTSIFAIVRTSYTDTALTVVSEIVPGISCFCSEVSGESISIDSDSPFGDSSVKAENYTRLQTTVDTSLAPRIAARLAEVLGSALISLTTTLTADSDTAVGLGVYALFENDAPTARQLIDKVKHAFGSPVVRCTALPDDSTVIRRIAMCGGSGSEFISAAIRAGAQAFITSDTRYHDFVDYQNEIFIIDIGHFESESCTKEIFYNVIREKFPNFACYFSQIEENPIKYI